MTAADRALGEVDLSGQADRAVGGVSLGMRQRLGLAGAIHFCAVPEVSWRCGGVATIPNRIGSHPTG